MKSFEELRAAMVESRLATRGIVDPRVLDAFRAVPREEFVPDGLREFAYEDAPLPLSEGQTISQPWVVAFTVQALALHPGARVLEVGTGSGYAAAILGHLAGEVYTIERLDSLAQSATGRLARLGFANVQVRAGDGSLGWPEHAPYDGIAVAAGGPKVPDALRAQLSIGGRLVIPVGPSETEQVLIRVTRVGESEYRDEPLADVRFVPLIGAEGWTAVDEPRIAPAPGRPGSAGAIPLLVREEAEPIADIDSTSLDALIDRIAGARVVLLGEATQGTSEFYRMRARITKELVTRRGFQFVAVEADWPDAARIDDYALDDYALGRETRSKHAFTPFARFPAWMWRNQEVKTFVEWLRAFNADRRDPEARVGFHGLDLYSLFTSIAAVLAYLDDVDPEAARVARARYGTLTPWQRDPAAYGRAVLSGRYQSSEPMPERLERAIGVVYRPDTELASHYFYASMPDQFDALVWFDETVAVHPLATPRRPKLSLPDRYPFGV